MKVMKMGLILKFFLLFCLLHVVFLLAYFWIFLDYFNLYVINIYLVFNMFVMLKLLSYDCDEAAEDTKTEGDKDNQSKGFSCASTHVDFVD